MTVVHTPDKPHRCGPNHQGYWHAAWNDQPGTVRECRTCGKSWVAYRPRVGGYMGVLWYREGFLARWRRRRKARRS